MISSAPPFRRSTRCAGLELSEIVQISEAAAALCAKGADVRSFVTGEPDFETPIHVVEAAQKAAPEGETRYPPTQGTAELRAAIAADAVRNADFCPNPNEIIVPIGAKQVLSNAFMATLAPGDEVILPAPYWTSYADMARFCGAKVVSVACGRLIGFRLTPDALSAAITPKTRWLILNNPGNPSGGHYSSAKLRALAGVLRACPEVRVMAEEIYQHITFGRVKSLRAAPPDLAPRTLIVNGVSKACAMTGWRLGWGIGPAPLIKAMVAVQGQVTSGASSNSQAAALAALTGPQDLLKERCHAFQERRDLVVSALNAMDGLNCATPGGAFYVFPDGRGTFSKVTPEGEKIGNDADLCAYILNHAHVALVPDAPLAYRDTSVCPTPMAKMICTKAATATAPPLPD